MADAALATLLASLSVDEDAASLAARYHRSGRNRFLEELAERGVSKREDRWAVVDALTTALRHGLTVDQGQQAAVFDAAAAKMPVVVRRLLVEGADPAATSVDELLTALGRASAPEGDVMTSQAVLSAKACASLRCAVDTERRLNKDS
eukprot:7379125-Prymnesium_polylepis.1